MTVEDLCTFLKADSNLNALIAQRVYPQKLPQSALLPALVFNQVHGKFGTTMENASGYAVEAFQISCIGGSYFDAKNVARKVRNAIEGFKGTMGSTMVYGVFQQSERDTYDPEVLEYRTDVDFQIVHLEN